MKIRKKKQTVTTRQEVFERDCCIRYQYSAPPPICRLEHLYLQPIPKEALEKFAGRGMLYQVPFLEKLQKEHVNTYSIYHMSLC